MHPSDSAFPYDINDGAIGVDIRTYIALAVYGNFLPEVMRLDDKDAAMAADSAVRAADALIERLNQK